MATQTPEEIEKTKAAVAAVEAEFRIKSYEDKIRGARKAIRIIGGIEGVFALLFFKLNAMEFAYIDGAYALLFFVLYFTSKRYPLPSIVGALMLYTIPWILLAIFFPWFFAMGIIWWVWRIAVIIALIMGVYGATRMPKPASGSDDLLDDNSIEPAVEPEVIKSEPLSKEPLPRQGQLLRENKFGKNIRRH